MSENNEEQEARVDDYSKTVCSILVAAREGRISRGEALALGHAAHVEFVIGDTDIPTGTEIADVTV